MPETVLYKLEGRSLAAAQRLLAEMEAEAAKDKNWTEAEKRVRERLEKEAPEILERAGLRHAATQVWQEPQTRPRAYEVYPGIFTYAFAVQGQEQEFFMIAPVDYKGGHFVPQDAVAVSAADRDKVEQRLFGDGWIDNWPLLDRPRKGVATPADYDEPEEAALVQKTLYHLPRATFIAEGRTLDVIEEFQRRMADWRAKTAAATGAVRKAVEKALTAEERQGLHVGVSSRQVAGSPPEFTLSLQRVKDGKQVLPRAVPGLVIQDANGFYSVSADVSTPEGQAFERLFKAIPASPRLDDYPELKRDNLHMTLDSFGGFMFISYLGGEAGDPFFEPPPGARFLPAEAYHWLAADQRDRGTKVKPPPMPPEIKAVLGFAAAPQKKPGGPAP